MTLSAARDLHAPPFLGGSDGYVSRISYLPFLFFLILKGSIKREVSRFMPTWATKAHRGWAPHWLPLDDINRGSGRDNFLIGLRSIPRVDFCILVT